MHPRGNGTRLLGTDGDDLAARVCTIRCSNPVKLSGMFAKPVFSDRLA
jgi:hypothetical protein